VDHGSVIISKIEDIVENMISTYLLTFFDYWVIKDLRCYRRSSSADDLPNTSHLPVMSEYSIRDRSISL